MGKPDTIRTKCRQYGTILLLVLFGCSLIGCGSETEKTRLISLHIKPDNMQIALGKTGQYTAMGHFADGTERDITRRVSWVSSDERIAAIGNEDYEKGKAAAYKRGTAVITALEPVQGIINSAKLLVGPPELTALAISPPSISLHTGQVRQFAATGHFSDRSVRNVTEIVNWLPSETAQQMVSNTPGSKGCCRFSPRGPTEITAVDPQTGIFAKAMLLPSAAKLVAIEVTPPVVSLPAGRHYTFTATGTYDDGTTCDLSRSATWSSSVPLVAAADNTPDFRGRIIGRSVGKAAIKAADPHSLLHAKAIITITPPVLDKLMLKTAQTEIIHGVKAGITAWGTFSDGARMDRTASVVWHSSNASVAIVNGPAGGNQIAARSPGKATIRAEDSRHGVSSEIEVTVVPSELTAVTVEPRQHSLFVGDHMQLAARGIYSNQSSIDISHLVSWLSSNPEIAGIQEETTTSHKIVALRPGEAFIHARHPRSGKTGQARIVVHPPMLESISIAPQSITLPLGKYQVLKATGRYSSRKEKEITQLLEWRSSNDSAAAVRNEFGSKGLVTSRTIGVCRITAVDGETGILGKAIVEIKAAQLVEIEVRPAASRMRLGTMERFTAKGKYTDGSVNRSSWELFTVKSLYK